MLRFRKKYPLTIFRSKNKFVKYLKFECFLLLLKYTLLLPPGLLDMCDDYRILRHPMYVAGIYYLK